MSVKFFKQRPVVIQALQMSWENWNAVCEFADVGKLNEGKSEGCYLDSEGKQLQGHSTSEFLGLLIPNKHGVVLAKEGDFIIKTTSGEIYPCSAEEFEKNYEEDVIDQGNQDEANPDDSLKVSSDGPFEISLPNGSVISLDSPSSTPDELPETLVGEGSGSIDQGNQDE